MCHIEVSANCSFASSLSVAPQTDVHQSGLQLVIKSIPGMRAVNGHGGQPLSSVAQMVIDSVNHTDVDLRKELFGGVVLTGACSCASRMCFPCSACSATQVSHNHSVYCMTFSIYFALIGSSNSVATLTCQALYMFG
jgi:hypothetical protein